MLKKEEKRILFPALVTLFTKATKFRDPRLNMYPVFMTNDAYGKTHKVI